MKQVCLFFALILLASPVLAQEFDFDRAYQDYLHTYNQYRDSHNQYVTAKNQHLSYQTLSSKNQALIKSKEMLIKRDQSLETYLIALRLKLAEITSVVGYQANLLYMKLDQEINWLINHRKALPSAGTLEDLLKLGEQPEKRYLQTEIIIYQTLGEILQNKETALTQRARQLTNDLKTKIQVLKKDEPEKALIWERWLLESENKTTRAFEKQKQSRAILQNLDPKEEIDEQFYQAQFVLKESNQYLKEAVFYLKEIIQEIKNE